LSDNGLQKALWGFLSIMGFLFERHGWVWVWQWRGKWQTAIQCHIEDCRMATVKAKPTYGKKKYIVVYMVRTRMYLWVDEQNVCPLTKNPSPLVSGYHLEWREMVAADTGAPRRRLFLSLGWDMLDISDRLHILVCLVSSLQLLSFRCLMPTVVFLCQSEVLQKAH
jgi:hypothetical protein